MPTYGYRCGECDHEFDKFHSMKAEDVIYCPECGKESKRLMSSANVIYKGNGFYTTDYR